MQSRVGNKQQKTSGFTLVELIIVIVVIAILAAISIVAYNGVQERARDAIRLSHANAITKTLEIYHVRNGSYFGPTSANGSWETSNEDTPADFMETLVSKGLLDKVPVDPINSSSSYYAYYRYSAGSYGCDSSRGAFFVFGIKDLETSGRPSADSPGWSCPSRDWETEFDWVTGGFER